MTRQRVQVWLIGAVALTLLAGCGEELGPEVFETTTVTGVVTVGHQPVRGGWVEFIPVEGTRGNLRSAPIDRNGRFVADRVAVGKIAIGLVNPPIDASLARLFRSFSSPIRRTIARRGAEALTIDLLQEAIHYRTLTTPAS